MTNMFHISPTEMNLSIEMRHLRVATYCRISTEQEEQASSIQLQELHYMRVIDGNPNWENVGIFSEKATGLNIRERTAFRSMINSCKKGKINLILTKSISRFGRNTPDMLRSLRYLIFWEAG